MKKIKFVSALMVCITLLMSVVGFQNKSYAKLEENKQYVVPETPYQLSPKFIIDYVYNNNSTGNGTNRLDYTYEVTEEMVKEKKAILAEYISSDKIDAITSSHVIKQKTFIYKNSDEVKKIKKLFSEKLGCKEEDITIKNTYYGPAVPEAKVGALDSVIITSEMEGEDTKDEVVKIANYNIDVCKGLYPNWEDPEEAVYPAVSNLNLILEQMDELENKEESKFPNTLPLYKEPGRILEHCNYVYFESEVNIKDIGTYSFVVSDGTEAYNNRFYYVYREDKKPAEPAPDPEPAKFETSLDYEGVEGTEVKKKATSEQENPFLPHYMDNDNNKKDMDAIAYIRSKTEENIVSVDGAKLTEDGKPNEKGWYYPDTTNKKVVAKKYPFDTYNNKVDNGKVNENVEVIGENGGKAQENPNIEWTFRRKIVEEETKPDGSKVITITFNLPIDEKRVEEGWTPLADEDGAVRRITRTFKKNESYEKDVPAYQNETGKEIKTPVKLTPPVISKTGETTFFIVAGIVAAAAVVVVIRRKIK